MRPATDADADELARVIEDRRAWMKQRGFSRSRDETSLPKPGQSPDGPRTMLLLEDDMLLGVAVLIGRTPVISGWTATEQTERAVTIAALHTNVASRYRGDRIGQLMTWAVGDFVARTDPKVHWIRCLAPNNAVMKLLRDRDAWQLVRETQDATFAKGYLMQRLPERKTGLRALIASPLDISPYGL